MQEFLVLAALITFVVTVTGLLLAGVVHAAVTSRLLRGGPVPRNNRSDHRDGAVGAVDDRVAGRTQQHSFTGPRPRVRRLPARRLPRRGRGSPTGAPLRTVRVVSRRSLASSATTGRLPLVEEGARRQAIRR